MMILFKCVKEGFDNLDIEEFEEKIVFLKKWCFEIWLVRCRIIK